MGSNDPAHVHNETEAEWLGEADSDQEQGQTDKDETAGISTEALHNAQSANELIFIVQLL